MSKLFDKIYGCEAAGTIANSMGDVTEGATWQEIEEKWGFVDTMLPQDKPGERTVVIYEELEFDVDVDESFFSLRNLRGR